MKQDYTGEFRDQCLAPLAGKAGFCFLASSLGMKAAHRYPHWSMGGVVGISLHSSFFVNVEVSKFCGLLDRGQSLLLVLFLR
jgi:hypothetical protein